MTFDVDVRNISEAAYLPEGLRFTSHANREAIASLSGLERALASGAILEGMVTLCDASMTLHIEFPQVPEARGLMERSEVVYARPGEEVKDIAVLTRVGKPTCFKILGMETTTTGERILRLSRRAAQAECLMQFMEGLRPGDVIPAKVTHLETFGAFVDIGCGLPSLLSVDTISISRIAHPKDRLTVGQLIWTVVRQIDPKQRRIFASMRELLGTWEENAARFEPGQTVAGIVRSVEPYGVFVELAPNLAGLAELREEDRAAAHGLIGRRAAVFIKSILPEKMKIKLVLIDTTPMESPAPTPLPYYISGDQTTHLSHWSYAPPSCNKRIETHFED